MNNRIRIALQVGVAGVALATGALAAGQGITGQLGGKAREQAQQQEQRSGNQGSSRQQSSSERSGNQRSQGNASRNEQPSRSAPPARNEQPARSAQPSRSEQPARNTQPSRSQPPARTAQPATPAPDRGNTRQTPRAGNERPSWQEAPRQSAPRQTPPVLAAPAQSPQSSPSSGSRNSGTSTSAPASGRPANSGGSNRDADRGVLGTLIQREYQTGGDRDRDRDDRDGRDRGNDRGNDRGDRGNDRGDRGNDRGYDGRDRDRDRYDGRRDRDRHVHVIHHLPAGYRDYVWNGTHYYYHGGYWYRPQGNTYISVTLPYGLFVSTLPGAYTSIWFGGIRYFYSDYHYYVYEPVRRGYVVVESPYDDEDDYQDSYPGQDLFIYPAEGQSEQQQADDRYDCHRWAVDQTGYDPIDDEYDADLREDYLRAMTACLTGRGYTVR